MYKNHYPPIPYKQTKPAIFVHSDPLVGMLLRELGPDFYKSTCGLAKVIVVVMKQCLTQISEQGVTINRVRILGLVMGRAGYHIQKVRTALARAVVSWSRKPVRSASAKSDMSDFTAREFARYQNLYVENDF